MFAHRPPIPRPLPSPSEYTHYLHSSSVVPFSGVSNYYCQHYLVGDLKRRSRPHHPLSFNIFTGLGLLRKGLWKRHWIADHRMSHCITDSRKTRIRIRIRHDPIKVTSDIMLKLLLRIIIRNYLTTISWLPETFNYLHQSRSVTYQSSKVRAIFPLNDKENKKIVMWRDAADPGHCWRSGRQMRGKSASVFGETRVWARIHTSMQLWSTLGPSDTVE